MADWKSVQLFADVASENVQFAFDDYQFVWVDGRTNNIARRVIINQDGEIVPSTIGVVKPSQKPEVTGVRFSDQNDDGTGIKRGKILLVCYSYVDDEEVESNPSPVTVIDGIQYQAKGYYTKDGENYFYPIDGGTYTFDQNRIGSIESFILNITIDTEFVRRVNVYVAEADYAETIIPISAFRLTVSKQIQRGVDQANVTIAAVPSILEASYENDLAPKGDDITLVDGITFIGNAVNSLGISQRTEKIWAITISNPNKFNYANRWIRLDMYDEAGVYPIGADILDGLEDWAAEDMSLYRLLDNDLTTPLELFHYPLDSTVKVHKSISVGDEGDTRAYILIGSGSTRFVVQAVAYGTGGNSITLAMRKGATIGKIACDSTNNDNIVLTTEDGIYCATVRVVNPGSSGTLEVACNVTDVYKHEIVVTLAHDGANPTSTAAEVIAALQAETEAGGELEGVIINVGTESDDEFDDSYVFTDTGTLYYFKNEETRAGANSNDVLVDLAYDSETDAITARGYNVINAINSNPSASAKVTARRLYSIPTSLMTEMAETNLAGGTGTPTAPSSDEIDTRMLSWIRIPQIAAYSEKTIYLVKFLSEPEDMDGEFVEIIASGTPSSSQILAADFYQDYVQQNPIADENVLVAERPVTPSTLLLGSDEDYYASGNAANLILPRYIDCEPTEKTAIVAQVYDELCNQAAVIPTAETEAWLVEDGGYNDLANTGIKTTTSGYVWVRFTLRSPAESLWRLFGISESAGSIPEAIYINIGGSQQISIPLGGGGVARPEALDFSDITWADGDQISIGMSWKQSLVYNANTEISVGFILNGIFRYATVSTNIPPNLANDMYLLYRTYAGSSQMLPTLFGLRINETIDNEWQMLNLLRFMPMFPTDGIGCYDEFAANTGDTISFVNKNVLIDTMQNRDDARPGRIQWGNYGSMPDLNEYSLNEDIMGITPIKSFQPTDEHNTILVFTKDNTAILALLGDSANTCTVTRQLNGIGLTNRNALCVTHDGVAWLSKQGIMVITASGIVNTTRGVLDTSHITTLVYDYERNWIWARGSYSETVEEETTVYQVTYVYQVEEKLWWSYAGDVHPDDFMGCIDNETGWISYLDNIMYLDGDTPHSFDPVADELTPEKEGYLTLIKTRAMAMVKKLGRIKLVGTLTEHTYKLRARMFSNRITGISTETAEFSTAMNSTTAIPGVGADYVQLDLKEINNIVAVAIEYENGVR